MHSAHPDRKQKIKHELKEMLTLVIYLAFFFLSFALYDMLLLRQYHIETLTIAFALINALVITKVIMIGEYAKLGRRHENKALLISAIWKAFVFALLVLAFHIVEEVVKRMIHGADLTRASTNVRLEQFAGRAIIVFCIFVPLFAWREFRRVMGEEEFGNLVFGSRHPSK